MAGTRGSLLALRPGLSAGLPFTLSRSLCGSGSLRLPVYEKSIADNGYIYGNIFYFIV